MYSLRIAYAAAAGLLFIGVAGAVPAPAPVAELTDAGLARVREEARRRREDFFQREAGKPLVKRAIKKDWNKRGDYTRDYGQSIVLFAMRAFHLNEQNAEANAALREFCAYHLARPQTLLEVHSFPSVTDALLRLCKFFGPRGTKAAGRLSPETYATIVRTMWTWADVKSRLADAEVAESQTWWLTHSENHHAQHFSTCWGFSMILKDESKYRDRKYGDGHTAKEHYAAWTAYLREYLRQRAMKGALIEIDSPSYAAATLKGIYSLYDLSDDEILKRRAGQFLELYWALWAEQQIDGVHGGGKTRTYADSAQRGNDFVRRAAWFEFGIGPGDFIHASMLPFVTTAWQMPDLIAELALDPRRGDAYEIRQRRMGLAQPGFTRPPDYRMRTDYGGILRYTYCTPDYIMGSLLTEARPDEDWAAISSQNRWAGVIFRGDTDARIYPQATNLDGESVYNGLWAAQAHGTLIAQKLKTNRRAEEWRVWFSKNGLSAPMADGDWLFAEAAGAFAAVRVVRGGYTALDEQKEKFGRWIRCTDDSSPVIIEVATKAGGLTAAEFRRRILALPMRTEGERLFHTGLSGDRFTFHLDQSAPPAINGRRIDFAPAKVFDSPFLQSAWDSGVVTLQKTGRKRVLDFNH